jgi:hypothetical protein
VLVPEVQAQYLLSHWYLGIRERDRVGSAPDLYPEEAFGVIPVHEYALEPAEKAVKGPYDASHRSPPVNLKVSMPSTP